MCGGPRFEGFALRSEENRELRIVASIRESLSDYETDELCDVCYVSGAILQHPTSTHTPPSRAKTVLYTYVSVHNLPHR